MGRSQIFQHCKDTHFFFYGADLIGPLFALVIYEIFSDLQSGNLVFTSVGFQFLHGKERLLNKHLT